MTAGRHTLELAAFYPSGDTVVEGRDSAALELDRGSVTASDNSSSLPSAVQPEEGPVPASDGTMLNAEILGAVSWNRPMSRSPRPVASSSPSGRASSALRRGWNDLRRRLQTGLSDHRGRSGRAVDRARTGLRRISPPLCVEGRTCIGGVASASGAISAESNGRFGRAAVMATAPLYRSRSGRRDRGFGPDGALYVGLGSRSMGRTR